MAKWSCLSRDLFFVFGSNPHTSHGRPVDRLGTRAPVPAADEVDDPGFDVTLAGLVVC